MASAYTAELNRLINVAVAAELRRVIAAVQKGTVESLEAFAAGMEVGAKGDMLQIHRQMAAEMKEAVLLAYEENVEAERLVEPYARRSRRSGYLWASLNKSQHYQATAEGIGFINEDLLRKDAAHWKRLNFGAGDKAGGASEQFPLRIFGQSLGSVGFDIGPQPAFSLPPGFFVHGSTVLQPQAEYRGVGTQGQFWPNRKSKYQPNITAGIRGRHFLEAGLEVMVERLPILYEDQVAIWIDRGGRKAAAIRRRLEA